MKGTPYSTPPTKMNPKMLINKFNDKEKAILLIFKASIYIYIKNQLIPSAIYPHIVYSSECVTHKIPVELMYAVKQLFTSFSKTLFSVNTIYVNTFI